MCQKISPSFDKPVVSNSLTTNLFITIAILLCSWYFRHACQIFTVFAFIFRCFAKLHIFWKSPLKLLSSWNCKWRGKLNISKCQAKLLCSYKPLFIKLYNYIYAMCMFNLINVYYTYVRLVNWYILLLLLVFFPWNHIVYVPCQIQKRLNRVWYNKMG